MKSPLGRWDINPHEVHYQDKLADVIREAKPKIIVETGLFTGLGAEFILKALDDNNSGHLYSIDPFTGTTNGFANSAETFTDNPIKHKRFTWIRKRSDEALAPLFKKVGPFDFFVHDSDHSRDCQTYEYAAAWNYVKTGGIIATDDAWWGDAPHAWDEFVKLHEIEDVRFAGAARWFVKP